MALGAYQAAVTRALMQARLTGRPVAIGNAGFVANPNGTVGTPGSGFGGQGRSTLPVPPIPPTTMPPATQPVTPSTPFTAAGRPGLAGSPSGAAVAPPAAPASWLQRPSLITNQPVGANTGLFTPTNQPVGSTITAPQLQLQPQMPTLDDYGRPIPTLNVYPQAQPQVQAPLNQANPNFTAGIQGAVGTQSGPPVHATYDMPPAPASLAKQAQNYRAQHGLATSEDADALNAESLAAARAGRTYLNPALATQYAQPQAAGAYGPQTNVVNALSMPPAQTQQLGYAPAIAPGTTNYLGTGFSTPQQQGAY